MTLILPLLLTLQSSPTELSRDALVAETRTLFEREAEKGRFSGTVLLAQGDEVLFTFACGEANKSFHVNNDLETRFNLGSMNKLFTSLAIAQLVEQGKLSYDDTLERFVDESWLPRTITAKITLRQLLTHTSGLGSYFNETFVNSSRELFRAVSDYKPLVRGETLLFEPGTKSSYSNTGMLLLGVVLEQVTGRDYFEHIRAAIYAPAGMTRSDSYEMDQPVENLAIGYEPDPTSAQGFRANLYQHVIKGGPAGGGFSTVGDLHRFALALLDGKLVSLATLDEMWTHQRGGHGLGFAVQDQPQKVVGHSGGFPGISANLDIFPESGYVAVVLANYGGIAGELSERLRALVLRTSD